MPRLVPLTLVFTLALTGAAQARDFPESFLWGPAISAFQTEAGGSPANADRRSDWWVWSHDPQNIAASRVSGDRVERGPGHWRLFERDARLARKRLGSSAFRFSIDWSPRLSALHRGRPHAASSTGWPTARRCATTPRSSEPSAGAG